MKKKLIAVPTFKAKTSSSFKEAKIRRSNSACLGKTVSVDFSLNNSSLFNSSLDRGIIGYPPDTLCPPQVVDDVRPPV
jgi:hypothetical protein